MRSQTNTVVLLIAVVLAAFVTADIIVINTPPALIQNQVFQITWDYNGPVDGQGQLLITDYATQTPNIISSTIPLQQKSFAWTVNVNPGSYYFTLTDSTSMKMSGPFSVIASGSTTTSAVNTATTSIITTTTATASSSTTTASSSTTTASSSTTIDSISTKPTSTSAPAENTPAGHPSNDGSKPSSSILFIVLLPLVLEIFVQII
ncbi:10662_t:CDS:2 [Paraglomus occultum]|uniref:10662_t:CDS:1 n=1 Tax=Paraglomus occultum TaxID=144539 RepID=A0A9N9BXD3_9GLOM|nr:10662_t:CDS:2 [Paraglomus occultum]